MIVGCGVGCEGAVDDVAVTGDVGCLCRWFSWWSLGTPFALGQFQFARHRNATGGIGPVAPWAPRFREGQVGILSGFRLGPHPLSEGNEGMPSAKQGFYWMVGG